MNRNKRWFFIIILIYVVNIQEKLKKRGRKISIPSSLLVITDRLLFP